MEDQQKVVYLSDVSCNCFTPFYGKSHYVSNVSIGNFAPILKLKKNFQLLPFGDNKRYIRTMLCNKQSQKNYFTREQDSHKETTGVKNLEHECLIFLPPEESLCPFSQEFQL